jgi:predicted transcriptional regulator
MIKLSDAVKKAGAKVLVGKSLLNREVACGYAGDMLSDVLAHAEKNGLWLTVQAHPNIIAVAVMKELSGILLVNGKEPEKETLEKAETEKIVLLSTPLNAFQAALKLYEAGLKG